MVRVSESRTTEDTLDGITRREVSRYVATSDTDVLYPIMDEENRTFAVVIVPGDPDERPSWVFVMARVVGEFIVIEEDGPPDKTLCEALMVNGGVSREKIVLAYKGESLPAST